MQSLSRCLWRQLGIAYLHGTPLVGELADLDAFVVPQSDHVVVCSSHPALTEAHPSDLSGVNEPVARGTQVTGLKEVRSIIMIPPVLSPQIASEPSVVIKGFFVSSISPVVPSPATPLPPHPHSPA